ncbi:MAG: adenine phosphoribosyltransferase [Nitrosopumilus sp.]|nr:adenine phosphoribosyltransferase [Nitrosopumilus sp.]CAI9832129.1 Adenine phosphoribosyltransferase [Nitrosopumilaceae archaeon]MDA7941373.1 adenine phosphoribosyltransferase [Nitrosopumilus sp.]MDA7942781.1 adenine phosphoribosyltransferase [Nitrosopumilus sp.]MDA7945067.1 adenine phosphoribosyltransferase [Nitrosopumilus sp.]
MEVKDAIAEYPDFPKKGVLFRDFGPVLRDPALLSLATDEFYRHYHPRDVDLVAGIESRGFILAALLAARYGKGMVMIRKAGKTPGPTARISYKTEYSTDTMEIQKAAVKKGQRVLVCDDLLATGGTAKAAASLVKKAGGEVAGLAFLIELSGLGGGKAVAKYRRRSLAVY